MHSSLHILYGLFSPLTSAAMGAKASGMGCEFMEVAVAQLAATAARRRVANLIIFFFVIIILGDGLPFKAPQIRRPFGKARQIYKFISTEPSSCPTKKIVCFELRLGFGKLNFV